MDLETFLRSLGDHVQRKNGNGLSLILSMRHTPVEKMQWHRVRSQAQIESLCRAINIGTSESGSYSDFVVEMVLSRWCLSQEQYQEAYDHQINGMLKFYDLYRTENNWLVDPLHVLTYDTRIVAMLADHFHGSKPGHDVSMNLRNAEQTLKKGFSMSLTDRAPKEVNKKWAALYVVNQLFKIYFKLNTIRLCRNLIRAVEGPGFPEFESFNMCDKVTYQFYVGRISMFEDQYAKAEMCLNYSWDNCHPRYFKNRRLILQYLIPVKLLLGILPTQKMMQHYELDEYENLTESIKSGNLYQFEQHMSTFQNQFIQQGVYLLIEKLKLIVYRNLVKKVYLIGKDEPNSHLVSLSKLQKGFSVVSNGKQYSMNEVECLLANLIYTGYLKGYMSHEKQTLVVSKATPFPSITLVAGL